MNPRDAQAPEAVAVIGMAGRFPQARNLEEFWRNLRAGKEAVSFFADDQVQWLPIEHPPKLSDPRFVKARAVLEKPEWFDAAFFGMNPKEAEVMDPQHRVFLECCWEALEHAGCNPDAFDGLIGVFAGASMNSYLFTNILTNRGLIEDYGLFSTMIMNDGDFVPTRVSYKLNLRGPSLNIQTACSTSLVAVCTAVQNLLGYRCDVALAGGVSITFPANRGQHHLEGGILSADGHCRAFDAKASGTVLGDGAGVVVLKRLSEAIADGDNICAVIKGTAINNDGAVKIGYTAPSIDGQAECIALAQSEAGVTPETISYIEAHGTGTPLGDPIEIAGLAKAFGLGRERGQFCAVGSVKSNLGHLDIGAGVAGLIKTVLALQHEEIPPSLHFETANPKLELAETPFFINAQLRPWRKGAAPRRAGVSSFGIGGTNAHAVLEEAPPVEATSASRPEQLLVLSAKTPTALEAAADNLAAHLQANPSANLADVAFTLQTGRKLFSHRRAVVARDAAGAIAALQSRDAKRVATRQSDAEAQPVAFLFTGQGAQGINMARGLYASEPTFRAQVDRSCEILQRHLKFDLRELLFPAPEKSEEASRRLNETAITQPALFVIEHALAQLWIEWGVQPAAMLGHSLGEYVAACLAGVFTLEDALALVAERARLMQAQPAGAMLAVRAPEAKAREFLSENLALAAVNAPGSCVVSGPFDAIEVLEQRLAASAITCKRLTTSHAFHSAMMEGALRPLADAVRRMKLNRPKLRWVSNVTGKWITPEEAMSPDYWAAHVRQTVRFADGVAELVGGGARVLLEVGPGSTLSGLARQHPATQAAGAVVIASLGRSPELGSDNAAISLALGELWAAGATIDWRGGFYRRERRRIVPLPTYPFERKRYWIEPGTYAGLSATEKPSDKTESLKAEASPTIAPKNEGETLTVLRELFRNLSGVDLAQAGTDVTFYQLGFDSLFLTQASQAVARRFGLDLTFRQLREDFTTLGKLAAHIDAQAKRPAAVTETAPALEAFATPEKRLPLTEAQRELWFASQLGAEMSAAYAESTIVVLRGALDFAALQRAVAKMVARHEALRTRFVAGGEEQIIAANGQSDVALREFAHDETAARRYLEDEIHRPFDLTNGPLLRVRVAQIEDARHLLTVAVHHIICDGWSLGTLMRELAELYSAEAGDKTAALAQAPRFSDYVTRSSHVAALAKAEKFWSEQYVGDVPTLELPTDRPRPAHRTYAGGFVLRTCGPEMVAAVKQLCAAHDCTAFTGLLAAFAVLLHRLSGQDDVVIGVPSAAQVMDGVDGLVGHFANLLPLRSRLSADATFADFLAQTRRQMDAALEHWRYPFGALLQKLNLARDSSRVPLAPVVFNTTRRRGALRFGELAAEVTANPKRFVNFDLNFNFALTDDAISLGCYYSTELYDEATIARWCGHFETLLRGVAEDARQPVRELPLMTETQRDQLLVAWNNTDLEYPRNATIAELFEAQAQRAPEAVAIVAERERITYGELNREAEAIATKLRALGVGPDALVGIYLERTPRLLAAIFGVLKAGGAYVPLDPKYPASRLEFIVQDTQMKVVVTQRSLAALQPAKQATTVLVDAEGEDANASRRPNGHGGPQARPTATSLAYIIYTSGSTGRPKGVAIVQRCVTALVAWAQQLYKPEELDGVLFSTSASFDISIFEIFCPLCLGGKIVLADNILQLATLPAANEVRFLSGVPSALAEVVRQKIVPASVTTIALAGETFPQPLVEALYDLPHVRRVYELYGPTETTVYSTGGLRHRNERPSLGKPFPNERVYILDAKQQPVPIGVTGEICIGGDKLARCYLNRPDLTTEKFIELPFMPGERVYRSGDLGRWRADGTIESLGRVDHQVKVRGYRIELGELESVLARQPGVRECAVIVRPDSSGNQRLLAYVLPRADATLDARELRERLQKSLPEYMAPSAIMPLEAWPLTTNGKLDRAALPDPTGNAAASDYVAPRTTTEEILVEIWRDVLQVPRVGVQDNFFELGGHSLLATQVTTRIHQGLGTDVSLAQFFTTPTIARLAEVIEQALIEEIKATSDAGREDAGLALAQK